jgi:hypothetical protein
MVARPPLFAAFGYVIQRAFINRFVHRPEHAQMLLMIALSIIIANLLLLGFGPDARNVQTSYQLDSFELGTILLDKVRVYAAAAAVLATALLAAFFRFTLTGKAIRACADNPLGRRVAGLPVAHLYAVTFGAAPPASPWPGAPWSRSSTSPPRSAVLHPARVRDRDRGRARLDGRRAPGGAAHRGFGGARGRAHRPFGQEHGELRSADPRAPGEASGPHGRRRR